MTQKKDSAYAEGIGSIPSSMQGCTAILTKLDFDMQEHRTDEDRKCLSITLCILRDFDEAKALNFENPDFPGLMNERPG